MSAEKIPKTWAEKDNHVCSGCGLEKPTWAIIDQWCSDDNGGLLCLSCQKKQKKGWYEHKTKKKK